MGFVEATYFLVLGLIVGFAYFDTMVRKWPEGSFWVKDWRERLSFFLWPRPPRNVVHIIMPNGQDALLYNLNVEEKQDGIIINTPLGKLRAPEKAALTLPIASIHLPGKPSPMLLVIYAITGLAISFMVYYYGYLFFVPGSDAFYWFYTILLGLFIYLYYTASSSTALTEYLEFEVHGIAPPFLHAVPRNISPIRRAKYMNQPILIRVTKTARESMENLKKALSIKSDSEVAELLATGELVELLFQQATRIRSGAMRVEKLLGAFDKARIAFSMGKITLGKVALMAFMFIVGLVVGLAMGGTDIMIGPPPADYTGYQGYPAGTPGTYPAPAATPSYPPASTPAPGPAATPYPAPSPAGGGGP